ncbi:hypothetical protein CJ178_30655 [Rhodococcus sp. ACPA4]|nr:hypothetical protein CJ178_30655 [Rhodococcus sp. ACPA4]
MSRRAELIELETAETGSIQPLAGSGQICRSITLLGDAAKWVMVELPYESAAEPHFVNAVSRRVIRRCR